ncbi:DUF1501 domain-containing protein [soil metagenome]
MTLTRREALTTCFSSLALAHLLANDAYADAPKPRPEFNGGLHHKAKVKRVVQLFMNGGASQVDTFDYKPELIKRHGQQIDFGLKASATGVPGPVMKSPFAWKQHGQSGRWVTDVFPYTAKHVDDLAFLMAMTSKTNVHGPGSYMMNTGFILPGFPCAGAWIGYALGRLTDNLPSFVVLPDPRGLPYNGTGNFGAGFLPANFNGTVINPSVAVPIPDLAAAAAGKYVTPAASAEGLDLLARMNRDHAAARPDDTRLAARIESYELAARMQTAAPEAFDLSKESKETHELYGTNRDAHNGGFSRNCLLARRLLERNVRFVQVWSGLAGPAHNWDNHGNIPNELPPAAKQVDQPIAALLQDLKAKGMLDDTLVIWTSEFGRMPFTQNGVGRDHNGGTFVTWLAGAGVKGGLAHGESDEFGYQAAKDKTPCYDLHATILHLMGIDHEKLTVRHNGIDRRLTDVHGHVIDAILS